MAAPIGPFFNFTNTQRAELANSDVLKGLNTYRNWGPFTSPIQKIEVDEKPENDKALPNKSIKSLFNPVYSVGYTQMLQVRQNAPLLDTPEMRAEMRRGKDCSIKGLVEASQKNLLGKAIYSYADFMYCKHLGKLSNNYLITLRRFPFPCGDHINYTDPWDDIHQNREPYTEKHNPDIGRLVTWLGTPENDMSKILNWNVKLNWRDMKGQEENGGQGDDNGGLLSTFVNATTNSKYRNQMVKGYAGASAFKYAKSIGNPFGVFDKGGNPPYSGGMGHDNNKAFGPLNVINRTHIRDTGMEFTHEISLVFDYELRSYDGINGKAAFLDLLGNILAVCYDNGAFWGGAYRGSGASQSNVFANLPIFKLDANSSFSDVVSAVFASGENIIKGMGGGTGDLLTSAKNIAQNILRGAFSALLGASLNALGRPQKQGLNSLLSPAPVGPWHLTIGNPWNPIMMIGNLIMTDAQVEQYGPLGLDDFPTGLKVTVKLKHGKDRDSTQIEHMFMQGENRIYTPVDSEVIKMYEAADSVIAKRTMNFNQKKIEAMEAYDKWMETPDGAYPELYERDAGTAVNMADFVEKKFIYNEEGFIEGEEVSFDDEGYNKALLDSQKQILMEKLSDRFFEWFGTNDTEVITVIAKEAAFGSKKSGTNATGQTRG